MMSFSHKAAIFVAIGVLLATSAAAQPSTVILVRHAEKATTPGNDPDLSAAGMLRARDLASALADARIASIIVTQLQRTHATARPTAEAGGVTPIVVRVTGDVPAHVQAVVAAVRSRPAGQAVLVVGHSNTIPAIVTALGGPRLPDLCDSQYGTLFILDFTVPGSPRLIRAKYGASDPPESEACPQPMRQP